MKTTKNHTVLSLALIFAAVTSVFSAPIGNQNGQVAVNPVIRYQVNVIVPGERNLCNTYLVEIRNERGQLVAPAKQFILGVSSYTFYERGPVTGFRVATLKVNDYGDHFICETELFTTPAMKAGPFFNGKTYQFNLIPQGQRSKH